MVPLPRRTLVLFFPVLSVCKNTRKNLYANLILSCGTIMFQEVFDSMTKEQTALTPSMMYFQVLLGLMIFKSMLSGLGSIKNQFLQILR